MSGKHRCVPSAVQSPNSLFIFRLHMEAALSNTALLLSVVALTISNCFGVFVYTSPPKTSNVVFVNAMLFHFIWFSYHEMVVQTVIYRPVPRPDFLCRAGLLHLHQRLSALFLPCTNRKPCFR
jgi:hypothetical protein